MRANLRAAAVAVLAAPLLLAACGGSGTSTTKGGGNYDPAVATLTAAGMDVCSEAQQIVPQTIGTEDSGAAAARGFFVSSDCAGKQTAPDTVVILQYGTKDSRNAAVAKIKAAAPADTHTIVYKALVIATGGPDAESNMTAIEEQLKVNGYTSTGG